MPSTPQEHSSSDTTQIELGLDALEISNVAGRKIGERILKALSPLVALSVVLAIWQIAIWMTDVPNYVLPSPGEVLTTLHSQWSSGALRSAVIRSFSRGFEGFILAILIATPIGVVLGLNRTLRNIFGPILLGLQQLPSVAWVPAAIIWFGLSPATIFAVILLGATPSIANGLISGIDQIPPIYLKLAKVLQANRIQKVRFIVLPAAWPGYLAGLEQGWAFAWRSLMAAELIAVSPALGIGVGQLLDVGRQLGDMSLVIGAIFIIMFIGVFVEKVLFTPIRLRTLRGRGFV